MKFMSDVVSWLHVQEVVQTIRHNSATGTGDQVRAPVVRDQWRSVVVVLVFPILRKYQTVNVNPEWMQWMARPH